MRCYKKQLERLFSVLLAMFLLLVSGHVAQAAEIDIRNANIIASEEGYLLEADFLFDFNPRLEEAVNKGVALYFLAEFELNRPRWYWFDEKRVKISQTWRLTYHALTRQYRLNTGGLSQNFATLDDALGVLSRLRNRLILERERVRPGETFDALLRMRLDTSQLPKPFQIEALANKDWELSSETRRWTFTVPDNK